MHEYCPDELDLRILHALQIEPRSSWSGIAPIVGADASTISRRWRRLETEGLAWVTGMMNSERVGGALIEIECSPGDLHSTVAALAQDPEVLTIDYVMGGRDLLVTVLGEHDYEITDYILGPLSRLHGIRAARTHIITERIRDARQWRLRTLPDNVAQRVPKQAPPRPRATSTVSTHLRSAIRRELAANGRASAVYIGEKYGFTPQRVTDAIARLRFDGELIVRTDVARDISQWPVYTWYFLQVPAPTISQVRRTLAKLPEARLAAVCSSKYNLILAVWLRTMQEVQGFEVALTHAMPGAIICDRSVVVRVAKHVGHLLDERGHATGEVVPLYRPDLSPLPSS